MKPKPIFAQMFWKNRLQLPYLGVDGSLVFDHLAQHCVDHAALAAPDLPDYRYQTPFLHRQVDTEISVNLYWYSVDKKV